MYQCGRETEKTLYIENEKSGQFGPTEVVNLTEIVTSRVIIKKRSTNSLMIPNNSNLEILPD